MLILWLILLCSLILFPGQSIAGACKGLELCASSVIPALFPFILLLKLAIPYIPTGKGRISILGLKGPALLAYGLSFLGGYPTGVSNVVSLYEKGKLTKGQSQRLLGLCNNSGPAFFISVIGVGLFGDPKVGYVLYGIHVLGAIGVLLISNPGTTGLYTYEKSEEKVPFPRHFQESLCSSCSSVLHICGMVVAFCVLTNFLKLLCPRRLFPLVGVLELCNGVAVLEPNATSFLLCSVFMAWGGLCVHLQAMNLWEGAGLRPKEYWINKILHALFCGYLAYAIAWKHLWLIPFMGIFLCICSIFRKIGVEKKLHMRYNRNSIVKRDVIPCCSVRISRKTVPTVSMPAKSERTNTSAPVRGS